VSGIPPDYSLEKNLERLAAIANAEILDKIVDILIPYLNRARHQTSAMPHITIENETQQMVPIFLESDPTKPHELTIRLVPRVRNLPEGTIAIPTGDSYDFDVDIGGS
jgi:hypothetical protein